MPPILISRSENSAYSLTLLGSENSMKQILKDKLQGGQAMTANSTFHNAYLLSRAMWVIATFTETNCVLALNMEVGIDW